VKAEIERELIELYAYEKKHSAKVRDSAAKASDAVSRAIKRLYEHLVNSRGLRNSLNPVLREFGEHIFQHILVASGRTGQGGFRNRSGFAGCFQ